MRRITPAMIACWVLVASIAFGPAIALPSWPWLPIGNRAPFVTDKLSVLIVEETDKRTPALDAVFIATQKAALAAGGRYRQLDKDQRDLSMDEKWVQDAWIVKGEAVPWIVAATPRTGVNQALPPAPDEALKLLSPLGVK